MATDYYFHSVSIENFRSFKSLKLEKLRRINIIGGFNGVGKSALLESLFFVLDRRNAVALMKPIFFRKFETSAPIDPIQFLRDKTNPHAMLSWTGRPGKSRIEFKLETKPDNMPISMEGGHPGLVNQGGSGASYSNQKGLSVRTFEGHSTVEEESAFSIAAASGMTGTILKVSGKEIPNGQLVSTATRQGSRELAQVLSTAIRNDRLDEVVAYMKVLHPDLATLLTLQEGDEVQVYARTKQGHLLPIQYMGDGFQNLLHTVCALMRCAGGVVLLDEIDAAMHYSVVTDIWKIIADVAAKENCQIFATTHSRECINSAALGISEAGRSNDFQYIRLEVEQEQHRGISYSMKELANAETYNVEIR